jgi:hypothetical protein
MFQKAGHFEGVIKQIMLAEPKFAKNEPNAFDIAILIECDGQSDWWRGEMSNIYGKGNFAGKKQSEITMENLAGIGFQGQDLTTLEKQLIGKTIPFTVVERKGTGEYEGKTYYDLKYIGGNDFAPKAIDPTNLHARLAALGMGGSGPSAANTTAAQGSSDSPW